LSGCGLAGPISFLSGIAQTKGLGGTGRYAGRAIRPINTKIALKRSPFLLPGHGGGGDVDGPEGADHHTQATANAAGLIDRGISFGPIGGTGGTDPDTGSILTLAALHRQLYSLNLDHTIAAVQPFLGQHRANDTPSLGMRCGTGQLTGVATYTALGINQQKWTFKLLHVLILPLGNQAARLNMHWFPSPVLNQPGSMTIYQGELRSKRLCERF